MGILKKYILYFAWVISLLATAGSLFFSEIAHFPPCTLCWYQRIFMYPLVIILAVGILTKDKKVYLYALPASMAGMAVAAYHNLLYYQILPESASPCAAGVSCTTKFVEWLGFITIPFLSFITFVLITACLFFYKRYNTLK